MNSKLLLTAKDKPKKGKWILLSFQHVFAMFGATILVPALTGLPVSVALFTSGIGTLIYILCTNAKVPVYLGSSFAFISPIIIVSGFQAADPIAGTPGVPGYYGGVMTGLLVVGLIYILFAILIRLIGKGWIDKVFPPIVIGPMIAIIGFGLAGVAVGGSGLVMNGGWKPIVVAFVSMLTVAIVAMKAKGFFKIIPFLVGIIAGYVVAAIIGLVDFTPVWETIIKPGQWFKVPAFMFLGASDSTVSFLGTDITIHQVSFASLLTIAPIAIVTASEHIGDHAVLSKITGDDYLKDPGLDRTLLGDGIATSVAALLGRPANTTYGENTSVVGLTRIGSVWVTGLAAVIAIILSFVNVFVELINSIPGPVMGGISLILYGFIGMNGIRVLIDAKIDFAKMRNMIIASVMLVLGIGGATIGVSTSDMNIFASGMSLAAIIGVLLNLLLPTKESELISKEELEK